MISHAWISFRVMDDTRNQWKHACTSSQAFHAYCAPPFYLFLGTTDVAKHLGSPSLWVLIYPEIKSRLSDRSIFDLPIYRNKRPLAQKTALCNWLTIQMENPAMGSEISRHFLFHGLYRSSSLCVSQHYLVLSPSTYPRRAGRLTKINKDRRETTSLHLFRRETPESEAMLTRPINLLLSLIQQGVSKINLSALLRRWNMSIFLKLHFVIFFLGLHKLTKAQTRTREGRMMIRRKTGRMPRLLHPQLVQ